MRCLRIAVYAVYELLFYELLFYELLFYELLFYELLFMNCCLRTLFMLFTICCLTNCLFYELLFDKLLFYELDFSTTVQLPQPTVTAMTVIPLTNNHCTFALLTNHCFNYHYQRLLIATPQLSSLLLHMKKPLQFWRCHE